MYKLDVTLINLERLIYHKTQPTMPLKSITKPPKTFAVIYWNKN